MLKENTALIGVGYWGSKIKRYIPEYFNLKYEADSKFNLGIIWSDETVKSVIIATPIEFHYEICKTALLRGKHVFIEKPITRNYAEALELILLAEDLGLSLGVDYVQTFSPAIKKIESLVSTLSPLKYIEMSTKHLGRFMGHDVYKLLASHHLSILALFLDISKIKVANLDHMCYGKYCTSGTLNFDKGRIDVSLNFPGKEMYMNIYGADWTIKYTPLLDISVLFTKYNKSYKALPPELTEYEKSYSYDESNNLRHAIKYFYDLCQHKAVSNATTAVTITKILSEINQE